MKILRSLSLAASLALTAVLFSGCLAAAVGGAAAGAGGYAYARGDLETTEAAPLDAVHAAAKTTLEQMEFVIETSEKDALEGSILARGVSDKRSTVKTKHKGDNLPEVHIRVGILGDEYESRKILENLRANLAAR